MSCGWVCGRRACAVHTSRCVSVSDSFGKTLGSGCWGGGEARMSPLLWDPQRGAGADTSHLHAHLHTWGLAAGPLCPQEGWAGCDSSSTLSGGQPGCPSVEPFLAVSLQGLIAVICTGRGVSGRRQFPSADICTPGLGKGRKARTMRRVVRPSNAFRRMDHPFF